MLLEETCFGTKLKLTCFETLFHCLWSLITKMHIETTEKAEHAQTNSHNANVLLFITKDFVKYIPISNSFLQI